MKYVTFEVDGRRSAGRLEGDEVIELAGKDLRAWLEAGRPRQELGRHPLAAVRLRAPIPVPDKFVAVGLNYRDHAEEQHKTPPDYPMFFAKANTCVVGDGEPIVLPGGRHHIDVEVELAAVVARPGRNLAPEQVLDHLLGFTIVNDVSDRKAQKDDRQYYRAKSWPTFGPMGPVVVDADEFEHRAAAIRLWRNSELQQESCTDQLIFSVEKLVSLLSEIQDLAAGDVISTGTPGGVGVFRDPKVFLEPGDEIVCEIEGIGRLRNPVIRT